MTNPCELSAVEARRLIGEGALSPVELFDACQKRIEEINPAVNAVVAERSGPSLAELCCGVRHKDDRRENGETAEFGRLDL